MVKNLGHRFNLCFVAAGVGVGTVDTMMTHQPKRWLADEMMDQHCFFRCCCEETGVSHRFFSSSSFILSFLSFFSWSCRQAPEHSDKRFATSRSYPRKEVID